MRTDTLTVATPQLNIGFEQTGPDRGEPIVLLHGFPYDVRQYDGVRDQLREHSAASSRLISGDLVLPAIVPRK